MIQLLGALLGLGAVVAFGTAVYSAGRVMMLVPAGKRLGSWFTLGWWQFDKVVELAGPGAHVHVRRYIIAVAGFLACVIGGIALTIALSADRINGTSQASNRPLNDLRAIPARFALLAAPLPSLHSSLRQES
jgi:hypothetical protein